MDKTSQKALSLLREIKSVTFSTSNDGKPSARIIDVMFVEDDGLYFLTARGKSFYRQLKANPSIAVCGMNEQYVSVRLVGDVMFCEDRSVVDKSFDLNPIMNELYPGEKRYILEGIHLYRGKGEVFDLSTEPPARERFSFGGATVNPCGYRITDECTACGICKEACPVNVITEGDVYRIDQAHCLECGSCLEVCPVDAIEPAEGL
ncbi:MAG TPA: 4Fe-4S binding protein [Syntrophales bacterium]|nr:4Fe-4S binding protein [Syntrophales bacterium]HPQ45240.1 4Fe-4S binding protein [Syntrophales bacterium]